MEKQPRVPNPFKTKQPRPDWARYAHVYECQSCGQLWAGSLNDFSGRTISELSGFMRHSTPLSPTLALCDTKPRRWVEGPGTDDVMAAFMVGGADAVDEIARARALDREKAKP